ncbi:phosphatidylserine decarboxylase-domain-containing protein [Trametes meyenii]|nr:phosphatidylserine decarboxylase-domain-containing protein [Trametes meyenii]
MPSEIVQELRRYLDEHLDFKMDLTNSFNVAKAYELPVFKEWGLNTLDDYLDYYEDLLKWLPTENRFGNYVYENICLPYFIIRYAKEIEKFIDSPDSISEETIDSFYLAPHYHMQDYGRMPWKTFNEFFARKIKSECRPIAAPGDNSVILLDDEGGGCAYGPTFAGGKFCHSFLGTNDYHRQHVPVSGTVVEARVIHGRPSTVSPVMSLSAPDSPGYQFVQTRGLILIETANIGLVAVLRVPIGMAQVSSVVLNVQKGEEISYFQLGGSDIVMVFQSGAREKHYGSGRPLARASPTGLVPVADGT